MPIANLNDAEQTAARYLDLATEMELIEEEMKTYVEAHQELFDHPRMFAVRDGAPGVEVGRRKVASAVVCDDWEAKLKWLKARNPLFVERVEQADRTVLKKYLSAAGAIDAELEAFAAEGIFYRAATRAFYMKLARKEL